MIDKYLDLARELKNVEHEDDWVTGSSWRARKNAWKISGKIETI